MAPCTKNRKIREIIFLKTGSKKSNFLIYFRKKNLKTGLYEEKIWDIVV